jgi:Putative zinc-finger
MQCRRYIDDLISAHADGELRGRQEREADEHLASCVECRAQFAHEREVKRAIRTRNPIVRAPGDARLRIRARLGALVEAELAPRRPALHRLGSALRHGGTTVQRHPLRLGAGVAALMIVALLGINGRRPSAAPQVPSTPAFNLAVERFDASARDFEPNAGGEAQVATNVDYAWVMDGDGGERSPDESDDLARAYRDAGIPENVFDFNAAGYGLYGGRIEQSADGYPVSYTLYGGERGEILSICLHVADFSAPVGARYWSGAHTFYEYAGHSVGLTFHPAGHYVSILVSREPVGDLLSDVVSADSAS